MLLSEFDCPVDSSVCVDSLCACCDVCELKCECARCSVTVS